MYFSSGVVKKTAYWSVDRDNKDKTHISLWNILANFLLVSGFDYIRQN